MYITFMTPSEFLIFLFIGLLRDYIENVNDYAWSIFIQKQFYQEKTLNINLVEAGPALLGAFFDVWNFPSSLYCNEWEALWFLLTPWVFVGATLHTWNIRQTGLIWSFQFRFDPILINKIWRPLLKVCSYRPLAFISPFLQHNFLKPD